MIKKYLLGIIFCFALFASQGCSQGQTITTENGADVDLSLYNDLMAYSMLTDMTNNPDNYLGKSVRAVGQYVTVDNFIQERNIHYVLIAGVDVCCPEVLEFMYDENSSNETVFPEEGMVIDITGTFLGYEMQGYTYYYLSIDEIIVPG